MKARALLPLLLAAPSLASAAEPAGPVETPAPEAPAAAPPSRDPRLPPWLALDLEYRVRTVYVEPLELAGEDVREVMWTEQRLRTDLALKAPEVVTLHVQADVLAGVLFGDNGSFGGDPAANSGVALATKRPNSTTVDVGLRPGSDPLDPSSYGPTFQAVEPLLLNHVYADALLPVGLLRVGRQPVSYGASLTAHEGTAINRWGVSRYADSVDRALFATKLDEAFRVLSGASGKANLSEDDGLFLGLFHDWLTQGQLDSASDDTRQLGAALIFRKPRLDLGVELRDVLLSGNVVHLGDTRFDSDVFGVPLKAEVTIGDLSLSAQYMLIRGESREIAEGFAALSGTEPEVQQIRGTGAQVMVDYRLGPATLTFELDYATGDDDPRSSTPITSFSFARDFNVGLLLFEHVLAFESARSAAVGIQNLAQLDSASFPITEARTDGRFTNAIALFPQLKLDLVDRPRHKLHHRTGVLVAWPEAAGGAVDPIRTTLRYDGAEIADDAVNYAGGKPGSFYGVEIDQQLQWTFADAFVWTVEGAVLLPGDALENEHGLAVPAFLVENRLAYLF